MATSQSRSAHYQLTASETSLGDLSKLLSAIVRSLWTGAILVLSCAAAAVACFAQSTSFRTLAEFNRSNGASPSNMTLVRGVGGNFYGVTYFGGANDRGTVFKVTPGGAVTVLYSFCSQPDCHDGDGPVAGLTLATDGNFYGTTSAGGEDDLYGGTIFRMTPAGALTTLHSFRRDLNSGFYLVSPLVQGTDGNFYGMTELGGERGLGTVFRMTPAGGLTTIYTFSGGRQGGLPAGGLVQASDGNFYGTTYVGGTHSAYCGDPDGCGTVFRITPAGALTTLYSFCVQLSCADGLKPWSTMVAAADGNFYGLTSGGGSNSGGTVFQISPAGTLTTLRRFCAEPGCPDGQSPYGVLVQGNDGRLYGTTSGGGPYASGTVFSLSLQGDFKILHSFSLPDGNDPTGGLVQAPNGFFYGTTMSGGADDAGIIYRLGLVCGPVNCQP